MNAFLNTLKEHKIEHGLKREKLTTLQVNMGNLCNQRCAHCHIDASPDGVNIMLRDVVNDVLRFLSTHKIRTLDITGGAPELNPYFDYLVSSARPLVEELIVRSNLTVFFEPGKEHLPRFFKDNGAHVISSLPCYLKENVDGQRGDGAYEKSIKALRMLNELGYTTSEGLYLDLVYNPSGAALPPDQVSLEKDYKRNLKNDYGVEFNRLITITNVPIKRFKKYLESRDEYEQYYRLLKENFNPIVLGNVMCRTFLSVGHDGRVFDCDFNQALDMAIKSEEGSPITINGLDPKSLEGREIAIGSHCLSCTAGSGSSCQGALADGAR